MMEKQPKYMELVSFVHEKIKDKSLQPGDKLCSENDFKQMFQMSRQTVRHGLSVLEQEGLVSSIQGSGTYIKESGFLCHRNKKRIAVITTYVDGYIFPRTIQGIEKVLFESGYLVQIAFTNNLNSREREIVNDIILRDEVAGIIMETTKSGIPNPNLDLFCLLLKQKIPILFINSYYPQLSIPHVSMNDEKAGRKVTEYLIEKGHEKIAGIFKLDDGQGHLRYLGYAKALQEKGITLEDTNIIWLDTQEVKNLYSVEAKILARLQNCTAVTCYNDEIAFSLVELLRRNKINVPGDISVMSIDDSELATLAEVKLSSVSHPMEELGKKAAENLISMIQEPGFNGNYEFEVSIKERNSVIPFQSKKRDH